MTMSQSASPSAMWWCTSTPSRSASVGIRVGGATTRTRAPMAFSRKMLERATRLWAMSPQMATVRLWMRPLRWRMVRASSSAWVGCSCGPSPALITEQSTFSDSSLTAPASEWRTTSTSGCMAFSVWAVSSSVSPFLIEDAWVAMEMVSMPSRLPAISNDISVRVEVSKNRLIWVRPFSLAWRFLRPRLCWM